MSLLDVFSGRQSFSSWLTGRDPKEADVYANYQNVAIVSGAINEIATTQVKTAQENVYAAFEQLNNVKGLAEYVGSIEINNYDTVFESISSTIGEIATQLEGKAEDIKTYEEAPLLAKVGSSVFMGVCKVGEGLLSVVEDLGDGVASVIGWGAGVVGATDFQNDCANFIKSEWSHDAFNGYYNSDFAKMSIFTEDSAIAGTCKIAGKAVGYLYAGGVMAGQLGLSGATNVGVGLLRASGSTWGATMAGAIGGLGGGTESGLNSGKTFNQAFTQGLGTAALQGGLAFAGGKVGEWAGKNAAVREAAKTGDANAVAAAKATRLSDYQGYTDKITQAGQRFGEASHNFVSDGFTALKDTASASMAIRRGAADAGIKTAKASSSSSTFKDSARELAQENPLSQGWRTIRSGVSNTASAGRSFVSNVRNNGLTSTIRDGISDVGSNVSSAVAGVRATGVRNAVAGAVTGMSPEVPGVVAVTVGSAINENGQQAGIAIAKADDVLNKHGLKDIAEDDELFGRNFNTDTTPNTGPDPEDTPVPATTAAPTTASPTTATPTTASPGPGPSSPGPSSPGPSSPGPDTPATTVPPTTAAPTQPTTPPTTIPTTPTEPIPTTPTTPTPPTEPGTEPTVIVVPPSTEAPGTGGGGYPGIIVGPGDGGSDGGDHSGAGYDGTTVEYDSLELENAESLGLLEDMDEATSSIDEIVKGSKYTKIPTSQTPMTTTKKKSSNSVIPIAAGLSVAAAAGIGAKAYMDRKRNNETGEDDEDEYEYDDYEDDFESDEWAGDDDTIEVNYDVPATKDDAYLEEDAFTQDDDTYTARNASELADVQ
ncbi:MAG: hypothetical protein J6X28_06095 [Bacilli bacterium]|nr:hypothetical protein [Bacilli bacterium]